MFSTTFWFSASLQEFTASMPNCGFAYFLVCLHCNTKRKLQFIVMLLMFVCFYVIANGYHELRHEVPQTTASDGVRAEGAADIEHPFLFAMRNDAGEVFYRLRGQGFINDPNDFAQLVACVVPLVFIFWRSGKKLLNLIFVFLPVGVLLYGIYLTHSRGSLLALLAMTVVSLRRRIGTTPAVILACVIFAAAMSMNFTGGRQISTEAGADRTTLWSEGLTLLKTHPLFGVGSSNMSSYTDSGLTAHNSVVVCAAELGMFGLFFWSMFLYSSVKDALTIAAPERVIQLEDSIPEPVLPGAPFPHTVAVIDKAEINRIGRLLILSLTGFMVTGWFLSRALILTLFLLGGMVEVVYELALQRKMIEPRMRMPRVLRGSGVLAASLVLLMYIMLRVTSLIH